MPSPQKETLIKGSAKRSVLRLGPDRVVKRFHAGGALGRLRDGWRAVRERRALLALRAAGLRAPRPLGVRATARGWELAMERVPGGRALDEVLAAGVLSRLEAGRLGGALGRQLAALDAAALIHPDLHAGNVLIDRDREPWLVDPARLRRGAPPHAGAELEARLVELTAHVRERSEPAFRRRFLAAYLAALPQPHGFDGAQTALLAQRVEAQARLRRREHVVGRLARWTRRSGATEPFQSGPARGMRARGRAPDLPLEPAGRIVRTLRAPSLAAAEKTWLRSARLVEHGLPCWTPARLHFAPQPAVDFLVPERAEPPAGVPNPRRLGELLGALHDRGLAAPQLRLGDLLVEPDGRLLLGPVELEPAPEQGPLSPGIQPRLWSWGDLPQAARGAFVAGFLRSQQTGPQDRRELAARLALG